MQVASPDAAIHENVISQFNIPKIVQQLRRKPPTRTILENSFGCVKPGEMLLVLGRPGQYIGRTTARSTALYNFFLTYSGSLQGPDARPS